MTVSTSLAASGVMGLSLAAVTNPSVGASPATYTNTSSGMQQVVVVGGTLTVVTVTRNGTGASAGVVTDIVMLNPTDSLTITYSVAPTLSVIQMT
jgi:hypothetical protein